jgi:hypothetical protein
MPPGGHRCKLTPETARVILESVERGEYLVAAAAMAGISRATVLNWLRRGEAGDQPYADFVDELARVLAALTAEARDRVCRGDPGWQEAARWLNRAFPRRRPIAGDPSPLRGAGRRCFRVPAPGTGAGPGSVRGRRDS